MNHGIDKFTSGDLGKFKALVDRQWGSRISYHEFLRIGKQERLPLVSLMTEFSVVFPG
jgi:hypothetical protein